MTTQQAVPIDTGNTLLNEGPAQLSISHVVGPRGEKRLAMTVRTSSTTLTVFLDRNSGNEWGNMLLSEAAKLTGLIIPNGS